MFSFFYKTSLHFEKEIYDIQNARHTVGIFDCEMFRRFLTAKS